MQVTNLAILAYFGAKMATNGHFGHSAVQSLAGIQQSWRDHDDFINNITSECWQCCRDPDYYKSGRNADNVVGIQTIINLVESIQT